MKLFETHYQKATKEFYLNILPFGKKSLFTFYFSQIDSSLHPKFYFRNVMETNVDSLFWTEFVVGKFVFSFTFLDYERWYFDK